MYSAILISHIVISILLILLAIYIVIRSFFGVFGIVNFSTFQDFTIGDYTGRFFKFRAIEVPSLGI